MAAMGPAVVKESSKRQLDSSSSDPYRITRVGRALGGSTFTLCHRVYLMMQKLPRRIVEGGVPSNKILLVGFSQGSAMALLSGLTLNYTLGGIAALAGWLPTKLREVVMANHSTHCPPIFWAHGTADTDIPLQSALEVMQWLHTLDIKDKGLSYHEYPGLGHGVNDDVLGDLTTWFNSLL